jgi:hypothetical protein
MEAYKTRSFANWATGEDLDNDALATALLEMERGLIDAHLGGQVVKKRVAVSGRGKRGSTRMLIAFKQGEKAFFIFGFAKSARANVSDKELKALKLLAKELFSYSAAVLSQAVEAGELLPIEVRDSG